MAETPPEAPDDHAEDFAHRCVDRIENAVEGRFHALDIPEGQVGASDHKHGVRWRVVFPHEREGGGIAPGGRINVDSGVFNPDRMAPLGAEASEAWAHARLRDRIDAVLAHEYEEAKGGSHEYAYQHAPETSLPIGDRVRGGRKRGHSGRAEKAGGKGDILNIDNCPRGRPGESRWGEPRSPDG